MRAVSASAGGEYEVVEVITLYQFDELCRSALRFIESLRLTLCLLTCPEYCSLETPASECQCSCSEELLSDASASYDALVQSVILRKLQVAVEENDGEIQQPRTAPGRAPPAAKKGEGLPPS